VAERDGRFDAEVEQGLTARQGQEERKEKPAPRGQAEGRGGLVRQRADRVPCGQQAQRRRHGGQRQDQDTEHQALGAQLIAAQDHECGESHSRDQRAGR